MQSIKDKVLFPIVESMMSSTISSGKSSWGRHYWETKSSHKCRVGHDFSLSR